MCGRFAATTDPARLAQQLDAVDETGAQGIRPPNFNVAPTVDIAALVCRHGEPGDQPTRRIRLVRWGLVPPWAKRGTGGGPPKRGPHLINARAETVTTSPAYRASAQQKRCLIPMDGYYEWRPGADRPSRGKKTPFYFSRSDGVPLLVAGLWSVSRTSADSPPLLSATIVTTAAVEQFAEVHDRMPLIVADHDWDRWLDPDAPAPTDLLAGRPDLCALGMREVSTLVNNVANNGPELIEPPAADNQPVGLF